MRGIKSRLLGKFIVKTGYIRGALAGLLLASGLLPGAVAAQSYSDGFKFIEAVKKRKGEEAESLVRQPGSTVLTARDGSGNGALHLLVRDKDYTWTSFMLGKGANPNMQDREGNTALALAALVGWVDGAQLLLSNRASVDAPNQRGETPLILAVHNRDLAMVRLLLGAGANPKRTDSIAGYSALDYAKRDGRAAAIVRELESPAAKPKTQVGPVF